MTQTSPQKQLRIHRHSLRLCAGLLGAALLLTSCSTLAPKTTSIDPQGCTAPDNATGLRLEMVGRQMMSGQYHAALAHLDTIDATLPQGQLMRARALRAIYDSDAAAKKYHSLLNTCLAAYAHQGLGIIAADRRDMSEALLQLQTARKLAPIDADIRNDYGFVLLAAGRINESLRELRTAVELESSNTIATRNLVLALFVARRDDEARATAHSHAFADGDVDALAMRARNYKPLAVIPAQQATTKKSADRSDTVTATAQASAAARTNIIVRHTRKSAQPAAALVEIPVDPTPVTPLPAANVATPDITDTPKTASTSQEVSNHETH